MAVPVRLDMLAFVNECGGRLSRGLANGMTRRADRLRDLARGLPRPERLTEDQRQRLDAASDRLDGALNRFVSTKRVALADVAGGVRPTVLSARIAEARRRTDDRARQLVPALKRKTERRREALAGVSVRLRPASVASEITRQRERTGMLGIKMSGGATQRITTARATLDGLERLRKTLGYEATLERGFAVVRSAGAVITQVDDARASDALEIQFKDGRVSLGSATELRDVEAAVKKRTTAPKKRSKKDEIPPEQGTLL
jgi:exodeoxyribonuclease VII large subunit